QLGPELLRQQAAQHVGVATRRVRHDDGDGLVGLSQGRGGGAQSGGYSGELGQEKSSIHAETSSENSNKGASPQDSNKGKRPQAAIAAPRMRSTSASGSSGTASPRQATCWSGRESTRAVV